MTPTPYSKGNYRPLGSAVFHDVYTPRQSQSVSPQYIHVGTKLKREKWENAEKNGDEHMIWRHL